MPGRFTMPALGADMESGILAAWRVAPGDRVRRGDIVAEVETDKGLIEVETFVDGVVERLLVPEGAHVPVGTPLAEIGDGVGAAPDAPARAPAPATPVSPAARAAAGALGVDVGRLQGSGPHGRVTRADVAEAARPAPAAAPPSAPAAGAASAARPRATPVARRRARERGLALGSIAGSGPGGRVQLRDVDAAPAPSATPATSPGASPEERMRRAIAAAMARSSREIPHFHLRETIDLEPATALLARLNAERPITDRLLLGALLVRAVARAARAVPELNARWEDGRVVPLPDVHVGMAIALRGGGLVAPAIRDADQLDLDGLMAALRDLVARARAGRLRGSEVGSGTITITSLGERGVEEVHGLVFPPQVALVGFGAPVVRPWIVDGRVEPRTVLVATLAADHRVADGHRGSVFLRAVAHDLEGPEGP